MGKPAARLTDMHACPMVDGVKPHVGGPVTGPGAPTVLIGGMPAAVQGDMCVCVGAPDTIMMGSAGVKICGKPAARMGDMTLHGGSILAGCPTVLIGETGSGAGGSGGQSQQKSTQTGAAQAADNSNAAALKQAANEGQEEAERSDKNDYSAQFELLDKADKGVKDVKYQINTPDGKVHEGKTDGSGKTEQVQGYTASECRITYFNN